MEALRRAEEAKSRAARQEADASSNEEARQPALKARASLSLSEQPGQDTSDEPERIDFGAPSTLSLRSIEPQPSTKARETAAPEADDEAGIDDDDSRYDADYSAYQDDGADENSDENFDDSGVTDEVLEGDALENEDFDYDPRMAEEELVRFEENMARRNSQTQKTDSGAHAQNLAQLRTANSLFQGKRNPQARQRALLAAALLLVLLLPAGGGLWWYLAVNPSPYANVAPLTASQSAALQAAAPAPEQITATETALPVLTETAATPEAEPVPAVLAEAPQPAPAAPVAAPPAALAAQPEPAVTALAPAVQESSISLTRTSATTTQINPELQTAWQALQRGDMQTARIQYQRVLEREANNRDAMLGLAMIHRSEGNPALAQNFYSRLLQLNPRDPLAHAGLLDLNRSQDFAGQERELRNLLAQHPQVAPLAFALGNLYASRQRWQEAQAAYFESLRIARASEQDISPDYAFNLAVSLEHLNQPRAAYDFYREAQTLAQGSPAGFSMELLQNRLNSLQQVLP